LEKERPRLNRRPKLNRRPLEPKPTRRRSKNSLITKLSLIKNFLVKIAYRNFQPDFLPYGEIMKDLIQRWEIIAVFMTLRRSPVVPAVISLPEKSVKEFSDYSGYKKDTFYRFLKMGENYFWCKLGRYGEMHRAYYLIGYWKEIDETRPRRDNLKRWVIQPIWTQKKIKEFSQL
jgi:hypothetical protein